MRVHRTAELSLALLFAAAGAVFGQSTTSTPATPIAFTQSVTLPPTGVGSTETWQVTIRNTVPATLTPVSATAVLGSCTGTVAVLDATGKQIASSPFTAAQGDMGSVKFTFSQLASSGPRVEVRGTVSVTGCTFEYSLETFDTSSGATHLFLTGGGVSVPIPLPFTIR